MLGVLPPCIVGDIQGSVEIVILKPAWFIVLPEPLALWVHFHFWGRNDPISIRFSPDDEKMRLSMGVCCDGRNFRNYLQDSHCIKIGFEIGETEDRPTLDVTKKVTPRRRKWNAGDHIGSIYLKNIKLNQRGEFIQECDIVNTHSDFCGSTTVLLLFSSTSMSVYEQSSSNKDQPNNEAVRVTEAEMKNFGSSTEHSFYMPNMDTQRSIDSSGSILNYLSEPKNSQRSSLQKITRHSDIVPEELSKPTLTLNKLLKLADCGLVSPSDIPMLVQICDGTDRSVDHANVLQQLNFDESVLNPTKETSSTLPNILDNCNADADEEASTFLPLKISPKVIHQQVSSPDKPDDNDSIVIVVKLFYVKLPTSEGSPNLDVKQVLNTQNRKDYVKQRSKMCFLLSLFVTNETGRKISSELTFVSRQIDNGVIKFDEKKHLTIPNIPSAHMAGCSLHVRITCRKLGERLGVDLSRITLDLEDLYAAQNKVLHGFPFAGQSTNVHSSTDAKAAHFAFQINFTIPHHPIVEQYHPEDQNPPSASFDIIEQDENVYEKTRQENYNSPVAGTTILAQLTEIPLSPDPRVGSINSFPSTLRIGVHIIEAQSLPFVKLKSSNNHFYPNSYVKMKQGDQVLTTSVVRGCSKPVWNFKTDLLLLPSQLEQTKNHLILKLHHSASGMRSSSADPLIGFVSINLNVIFINADQSVVGWFPILDLKGEVCAQIKVGIQVIDELMQKHPLSKDQQSHVYSTHSSTSSQSSFVNTDIYQRSIPEESKQQNYPREQIAHHKITKIPPQSTDIVATCVTDKQYTSTCTQTTITEHSDRVYNLEHFTWMNQLKITETPCASYIDLRNPTPVAPSQSTNARNRTKRKSRIAANINLKY